MVTTIELPTALKLFVRREFIPADLRAAVCNEMSTSARRMGTVLEGANAVVNEQTRMAKHSDVSDSPRADVSARLRDLMPEIAAHFDTSLSGLRDVQFLRYDEGDFFVFHRDRDDSADQPRRVRERLVSAVMFLNDASDQPGPGRYGGGALEFYLPDLLDEPGHPRAKVRFPASAGTLVAFDPRARHQVRPVLHGHRYTAVTWFV